MIMAKGGQIETEETRSCGRQDGRESERRCSTEAHRQRVGLRLQGLFIYCFLEFSRYFCETLRGSSVCLDGRMGTRSASSIWGRWRMTLRPSSQRDEDFTEDLSPRKVVSAS